MNRIMFALMLSAFALTNIQSSYAMDEVEEIQQPLSALHISPTSEEEPSHSRRWVPQAPVKKDTRLYQSWLTRANAQPDQYRVVETTPWVFQ